MHTTPFKLERYFARYEFSTSYLLSSSDCDGLSMQSLLGMADEECQELWQELYLGYTESAGHPLLRREIAKLYTGIQSDDVLVVVPEEGILIAMQSLLQADDHIICTFPGYQSLYQVAESLGCQVTRWLPNEEQGWRFDPHFLEENLQANTRLLVVNFPHNPTGSLPSRADYERVLEFAHAHDLYLFSDEMYRGLEHQPSLRLPSACEIYEKALTLSGMSKVYGLAGLRIGWLVCREPALRQRLASWKDYTTICSSAPSEVLALIGLRSGARIIARHQTRIAKNISLLHTFFERHSRLFSWVQPQAGTVCFPCWQGQMGAQALCQRLTQEAEIMLLPATVYDYDDAHVRVGFGRENLGEGLQKLEEFLHVKDL